MNQILRDALLETYNAYLDNGQKNVERPFSFEDQELILNARNYPFGCLVQVRPDSPFVCPDVWLFFNNNHEEISHEEANRLADAWVKSTREGEE